MDNLDLENCFLAYSKFTLNVFLFFDGRSNMASFSIASQIDLNPLAPNLNSTAFST